MIFRRVEPDGEHYRALRMVSEGGRWTLGLTIYASGTRVRMGRTGRPPSVLDFCMGTDATGYAEIFAAVVSRLESVPEEAELGEIDAVFPWAGTKPDLSLHLKALLSLSDDAPACGA